MSNFKLAESKELLVWLMWNEKDANQLDTGPTMWPCPLTAPMTLALVMYGIVTEMISDVSGPSTYLVSSYELIIFFLGSFPHKVPEMFSFDGSFVVDMNKLLSKQWSFQQAKMPWCHDDDCSLHYFQLIVYEVLSCTGYITIASHEHHGISNHQQLQYLFNDLFRQTSVKILKLCITSPSWGELSVKRWFSSQMVSNTERGSMWGHYVKQQITLNYASMRGIYSFNPFCVLLIKIYTHTFSFML